MLGFSQMSSHKAPLTYVDLYWIYVRYEVPSSTGMLGLIPSSKAAFSVACTVNPLFELLRK